MDRFGLDRESIDRLIKLLGMLGSAHDGERAAAGLKAHEFIKRRGLCWADVIRLPISEHGGHESDREPDFRHGMSWRQRREFCMRHLRTWRGPLTVKQQTWIDGIYARLRREAA
jgi:hypothetical protein